MTDADESVSALVLGNKAAKMNTYFEWTNQKNSTPTMNEAA